MIKNIDTNLSGIMHCWLAVTAEICGTSYVCLRGVNFLNEYRSGTRSSEKGNREHQTERPLWLHVPSVTFNYNKNNLEETTNNIVAKKEVEKKIKEIWPALTKADVKVVDQNFTSSWGATNAKGETETVTRLFLDFGKISNLPKVLLQPDIRPPYTRHPVFWVKAKDIIKGQTKFPDKSHLSIYKLMSPYKTTMELDAEGRTKKITINNLLLQETVGDIFIKERGKNFFSTYSM